MTSSYQPFPIMEFKTGINTYLQPWIRPADAFQPLDNAYIYRGMINKRAGYSRFGTALPNQLTITGISQASSAVVTATNSFTSSDYGVTTVTFSGVVGMTEINSLTGTVQSATGSNFTVNINSSAFTAYSSGGIGTYTPFAGTGDPVVGIMRYIDQTTSATSLLVASIYNLYLYSTGSNSFSIIGAGSFTGTIENFFNYANWQTIAGADSVIYMTNNVDNITTYNGTSVSTLVPVVDAGGTTITNCLDIKIYKQRMLLIRPTLSSGVQNQAIYWGAVDGVTAATSFLSDGSGGYGSGAGGFSSAPTGDIIVSAKFIRDVLVVFFTNSVWTFRFTGNDFSPFQWDRINSSKNSNCPYAAVEYDERVTSIGNTGMIASDGVNVQRYDIPIIDFYENNIQEDYYNQAFSQRYDNLNQTWMFYVSLDNNFPLVNNVAPGSDKALVYNFLENTWCTYTFQIPMTCLGLYYNISGDTWADLTYAWSTQNYTWDSYYTQASAPILLAGDTVGNIWYMDDGTQVTDKSQADADLAIAVDVQSTAWNPMIKEGQKIQFGYIDIYYTIVSTDPDDPIQVTLNFYINNSSNLSISRTLTLDGPMLETSYDIASGTGASSYSGTISPSDVVPESLEIVVTTSGGVESFDDNGTGTLIGSLGDTGTINYETGAWAITLTNSRTVDSGNDFVATYKYYSTGTTAFKRIYINLTGQFVSMEIDPSENAIFSFLGFILWVRPAGRLTPL